MAVSPDGSMLAVGGADPSDCQIFHIQHRDGACPVFTPMQTLVVCLAAQLMQIVYMMTSVAGCLHDDFDSANISVLCQGHQDWLFGVTWLTDRHLVTGVPSLMQKQMLPSCDEKNLSRYINAAVMAKVLFCALPGRLVLSFNCCLLTVCL